MEEHRSPGRYELVWDRLDDRGVRVPAGTYYVRVRTGTGVVSAKVVLVE